MISAEPVDQSGRNLWAWTVLCALGLVSLDAVTAPYINVPDAYILLVLMSLWSARQSFTYVASVVGTCLVTLGLFISPQFDPGAFWIAAVNRLLAIAAIWVTAFLCLLRQRQAAEEYRLAFAHQHAMKENQELRLAKATLEESTEELAATKDAAIYALARVAEARDMETGQHLVRISAYSHILARELQKDPAFADAIDDAFLADLYRSSPLHDIGKVGICDSILLKPGPLTAEEREMMERHTIIGSNILRDATSHMQNSHFLELGVLIAHCHHERFDGYGYPRGLSGAAIPLAARIVALADVYDAMVSERPYKQAYSPEEARDLITAEAGRRFDPRIVDAFVRRFADFVRIQLQNPNEFAQVFGIAESLMAEVSS